MNSFRCREDGGRSAGPMCALVAFAVVLLIPSQVFAQATYNAALRPYVEFLGQQKTPAKDYILSLFKDHDIVVLCERHHPEITQYDLFLSLASDPRFLDSVGNIFTEVGTITQAAKVNAFLAEEGLPQDSVDRAVASFQRNCSDLPFWEKTNYAYFVRGLYGLNQALPAARKVRLFNSDLPFDWNTIDSTRLRVFQDSLVDVRDSVIASQIIRKFDEIRASPGTRHKALVIMNYRHAFRHDTENAQGIIRRNVGRFLFDRYRGRFANAFINNVALVSARADNDVTCAPIQGGMWDAAFKVANVKDMGFDFKGSPFGSDTFDIWPANVTWTWADEFDGFVFYLPLDEQMFVTGMPSFVDSAFAPEFARRVALFNTLPGRRQETAAEVERTIEYLNERRESPIFMLDSLNAQVRSWLPQ